MADDLAQCYLMSYPPDVAASDLDEACEEMNATFRGDYGGYGSLVRHRL